MALPNEASDAKPVTIERLALFRAAMAQHSLDAYVLLSADPHLSEYLPAHWQSRQWLSGFTGSVGTLVVTADFAGLWCDARYWAQAETELAQTGIAPMKAASGTSTAYAEWLATHLVAGQTIGVDGKTLALVIARVLEQVLGEKRMVLRTDCDLIAQIWRERPSLPTQPIYEHLPPQATRRRSDRLADLRTAIAALGADAHFISTLDDIAYLLNLRGTDVDFNPVFVAHLLLADQRTTLFIAQGKVPAAVHEALADDGVQIAPYAQAQAALARLRPGTRLLLDPQRITLGLRQAIATVTTVIEAINPTTLAKSRKSEADIEHVRATMEQDGAALCEFFAWLEAALPSQTLTEHDMDARITSFRAARPGFVCASFGTIAGFNANGALPHYRATAQSHTVIAGDGLLLIDSGGQYLGGTTDITRVVPVGAPSALQKRDFTLVLKGLIALSGTRFPRGTRSPMLDAIARAPIWSAGIDYGHGTGHGVGYFLNVHEGPQVISSTAMPDPRTAMEPGMITSIEPGIYRPGRWGVRIENLVVNQDGGATEFGDYLRFETLTLCPIDSRCMDLALLRPDEREWINSYHGVVRKRLSPYVCGAAREWLEQSTQLL